MSNQIKKEMAFQLFEESEVLKNLKPEIRGKWFNRIDVNSGLSVETQIQQLENELSAFHHIAANSPQAKSTVDEIVGNMIGFTK